MSTRLVMIASAFLMLVLGVLLQFLPQEVLNSLNAPTAPFILIIAQLAGALYIGFALMNWMAKGITIGGIYARPVAIGNLAHFFIGGLALIKFVWSNEVPSILLILTAIYLLFAALFGYIFMTHPTGRNLET